MGMTRGIPVDCPCCGARVQAEVEAGEPPERERGRIVYPGSPNRLVYVGGCDCMEYLGGLHRRRRVLRVWDEGRAKSEGYSYLPALDHYAEQVLDQALQRTS